MEATTIHNPIVFLKKCVERHRMVLNVEEAYVEDTSKEDWVKVDGNLLLLVFKNEITPQIFSRIEPQIKEKANGKPILLMANYISPNAKDLLIDKKINYVDSGQNMSMQLHNLVIRIEGNTLQSLPSNYKSRAFTKAGGAVVFQFLMDPLLINASQRTIAEKAGVSLGTIPKVFEGLQKEGFIVKLTEKSWDLTDYRTLLDKWVEVLKEKILPAYYIGQFSLATQTITELMQNKEVTNTTQWGGEPAAALINGYLIPQQYSMFTTEHKSFINKYRLLPAENGEISVHKKFWNHSDYNEQIVHPVLIYAQLMASGDSRNIEAAEIIFNEEIKPNL